MKTSIKVFIIILFVSFLLKAQTGYGFFENEIYLPLNNEGVLADVNVSPEGALGKYDGIGFLFSGGFYLSGYNNGDLWANGVMSASLVFDYQPGVVGSDPDDPQNIIYVVSADDPDFGQSWQDWIDAVDLGADFYDGNSDGIYNPVDLNNNGEWDPDEDKPDILGDLTAWTVFNDGKPASQRRWGVDPQGIEIQQTLFAFNNSHPEFSNTENTIFIRYRIINKGTVSEKLDSVFFSVFSDFDIGSDYHEDLTGSDTYLTGSYAYKDTGDNAYGNNPPSIFHHFTQFPHDYIPGITFTDNNGNGIFDQGIDTALDTAFNHRGPDLGVREIPGAKNSKYNSAVFWLNSIGGTDYGEPDTITKARNFQNGLLGLGGIPDPCESYWMEVVGNVNCEDVNPYFWASGNPITIQGWLQVVSGDIRTVSTTGPFDLEEGDYYDIIAAYTVGRGTDHINSISVARQNVAYARQCYNSNFGQFPVGVKDEEITINDFQLHQNYPNPFNPSTTIKFSIPEIGSRSPLERGGRGVLTSLMIYDILGRKVATLVNEEKQPGIYEVNFNASELSSGIYFYKLTAGNYISTKKMILLR